MSRILREWSSLYDFQVFEVPPFCSTLWAFRIFLFVYVIIPVCLFPILLILLNLILKDENPRSVAHHVSVPVFPHPTQTLLSACHLLISSATLCFYSSLPEGEKSSKDTYGLNLCVASNPISLTFFIPTKTKVLDVHIHQAVSWIMICLFPQTPFYNICSLF